MLVASFGADTAWAGRRITHDEGRFVLEGFGVITAAQVLEYDAATPLVWSTGGTRAWVRSIAHRGEGRAARSAPPPAAPAAAAGPAAVSAGPDPVRAAVAPPAAPRPCAFARAHYVGGQPGLGAPLAGSLQVTAHALALQGAGAAQGPSVALGDVARVSLHGAQAPASSGVAVTVAGADGAAPAGDRTFVVAHLRSGGYEAFAVDGAAPDAVREALQPVLGAAGVRLQGGAVLRPSSSVTDEVARLAELHAGGALSDDGYRERLGPVLTAGAAGEGGDAEVAGGPVRMPDEVREAALERLNALRLSGVITDAELAAMRAKLLE